MEQSNVRSERLVAIEATLFEDGRFVVQCRVEDERRERVFTPRLPEELTNALLFALQLTREEVLDEIEGGR